VLFLIGSKKAPVELVPDLLDVRKTPRKPNYPMAPEFPLVLQKCVFPDFEFRGVERLCVGVYLDFYQIVAQKMVELAVVAGSMAQFGEVLLGGTPGG
jgi:hypothetical protein